jgi:hypothetical protein
VVPHPRGVVRGPPIEMHFFPSRAQENKGQVYTYRHVTCPGQAYMCRHLFYRSSVFHADRQELCRGMRARTNTNYVCQILRVEARDFLLITYKCDVT